MADEAPASFADEFGLILAISLAGAVFTVLAIRFKAWLYADPEMDPPLLPHLIAYVLAYLAGFAAVYVFRPPWSLLAMAAAAAPAFAITVRGRKPFALTADYFRTTAVTFAIFAVAWAIYALLLMGGIDISE